MKKLILLATMFLSLNALADSCIVSKRETILKSFNLSEGDEIAVYVTNSGKIYSLQNDEELKFESMEEYNDFLTSTLFGLSASEEYISVSISKINNDDSEIDTSLRSLSSAKKGGLLFVQDSQTKLTVTCNY